MKHYLTWWIFPLPCLRFTSAASHAMDELIWSTAGSSSRFTSNSVAALVAYDDDGYDDPSIPPEPQTLPTPTDVPVPEPHDIPVPEPMDVPPPDPHDIPPSQPKQHEFAPKPRPIP